MTDLVRTILVTGVRLGELLALDGAAFDAQPHRRDRLAHHPASRDEEKTVATVRHEAGLPSGAGADQLGNTRVGTEKHYIARRVANVQSADALESIVDTAP
jgi:hypothetical protein